MNQPNPYLSTAPTAGNAELSQSPAFQPVSVVDILDVIRRYIVSLIGLPIVAALVSFYFALQITPKYTGITLLQVDPKPFQAVKEFEDAYEPGYGSSKYYNTQIHLLNSRKLAEKLALRMNLAELNEFSGRGISLMDRILDLSRWLPFLPVREEQPALSDEAKLRLTISRTQQAVSASLVERSNLFQIGFTSEDPQLAAAGANAMADLYIEELLQARLDVARKASEWLTENLQEISTELNESESQLQQFRDQENLVNIGGTRGILESEILDLNRRLRDAQKTTSSLQNAYAEITRAGNSPSALTEVSALLVDPVVNSAANDYFSAQDEVRRLEKRYGARHPQMETAQTRLERARGQYFEQLRLKSQGIKTEYEIAKRNEQQLARQVSETKRRIQQLDSKQYEYKVLEREVTSNQQLYDLFLARFKESQSVSSYDEVNARIADPAIRPGSPSQPNKKLIIVVGFFLGLLLAIVAAVIREALRASIETVHDIEHITSIPVIAVLPHMSKKAQRIPTGHFIAHDPKAPFSDGIRSIRASIVLSDVDKSIKTIAVTSPLPSEGKSTICSGIAAAMAHNEKLLLLDGDLRRPNVHKMFNLPKNTQGISQVLSGECSLEEAILEDEKSGVFVLPAGRSPANPAQLLTSEAFAKSLRALHQKFDRILIDTPPCGSTSDAIQLAPHVDAYMLVVRAENTPIRALESTIKQLNTIKAQILGIALNDSSLKRRYGYYGYGYAGYYDRY